MIEKSRMELRRETDDVRRSLRRIVSKAQGDKDLATAQRALGRIKNQFSDPTWLPVAPPVEVEKSEESLIRIRPLEAGDEVEIKGLNVNASVISVGSDGGVELQMGNARIELNERQLRRTKAVDKTSKPFNRLPE